MNPETTTVAIGEQGRVTSELQPQTSGGFKLRHKAGVALLQKSKRGTDVLLVRQANGHWSLPKGKRKKGETNKQTGLRECLEETGREAQALQFVGWGINSRKHVRFYLWKSEAHRLCTESGSVPHPRRSEILESAWVSLARARQMLKPWQANLLAKIMCPRSTSAI